MGQSDAFRRQRAQLTAFNIGFNGLVGGVGGLINKSDNQTGIHAFAKGFYKGAIGGTISHIGLSLTHQIDKQRNITYAWPARLVNALGSSMIQNAAEGRRMFERLHFNLYVTRLEYYPYEKRFTGRFFTSSVYGLIVAGNNGSLDISKSLKTGIFYFQSYEPISTSLITARNTGQVSSIAINNALNEVDAYYETYAHEVAHILQYDRKVGGNALLARADQHWKLKHHWYRQLSRYIYFDLNGPIFYVAYAVEGSVHRCNLFEQEAVNYANRVEYLCH